MLVPDFIQLRRLCRACSICNVEITFNGRLSESFVETHPSIFGITTPFHIHASSPGSMVEGDLLAWTCLSYGFYSRIWIARHPRVWFAHISIASRIGYVVSRNGLPFSCLVAVVLRLLVCITGKRFLEGVRLWVLF